MTPPASTQPTRPPSCPRCGYDLAGAVARWETACDLSGKCTECGLDFAWRDVMNPMRVMPRWFFENPFRAPPLTFVTTMLRFLRPRWFWSRINLALPIRVRRLVLMLIFVALGVHVCLALASTVMTARSIGPYASVATLDRSLASLCSSVLLWPYKDRSVVVTQTATLGNGTRQTYSYTLSIRSSANAGVVSMILPFVLMPLTYLLLAETLRRTRVRPVHLFRVFAYSMILLAGVVFAQFLAATLDAGGSWGPPRQSAFGRLGEVIGAFGSSWLIILTIELIILGVWWRAATTRYLRLPHATGVVLAMLTITGLAMLVFLVLTRGGALFLDPRRQ